MPDKPTVYHIPVCPFSQRLEIMLDMKGARDAVEFRVVDITRPRDNALLEMTRGTTSLPIAETPDGRVLKESLILLRYLDELTGPHTLRRDDPGEHAVEQMLITHEAAFTTAGYRFVMNQDPAARQAHEDALLAVYRDIDDFLRHEGGDWPWLFDGFGLAEAVFTPMFKRFWFLEYYEGFDLPDTTEYARVHAWRAGCMAHPQAQQVSREEIVKLYYDYALGCGNGARPEGRKVSSFAFEPHWRDRPWPPRDKYTTRASDRDLGLLPA